MFVDARSPGLATQNGLVGCCAVQTRCASAMGRVPAEDCGRRSYGGVRWPALLPWEELAGPCQRKASSSNEKGVVRGHLFR